MAEKARSWLRSDEPTYISRSGLNFTHSIPHSRAKHLEPQSALIERLLRDTPRAVELRPYPVPESHCLLAVSPAEVNTGREENESPRMAGA